MSRERTPRDSAAVFIGGVAMTALFFIWWFGYWESWTSWFSEPVASRVTGEPITYLNAADGRTGASNTANLLASFIEGLMFLFGEFLIWLFTVGWNFAKWAIRNILKVGRDWADEGREAIEHARADRESAAVPSAAEPATPELTIEQRVAQIETLLGDMIPRVNRNTNVRKLLIGSSSFKAFRESVDEAVKKQTEQQGEQE